MPNPPGTPGAQFADVMQDRLIDFAVATIRLADQLPPTPAGRHIAGQILRCGTSPASNYGEARAAESRNDFVHKLKIVHKELNETYVWLRIIHRANLTVGEAVELGLSESDQLCRIIGKSIATANDSDNPLNDGRRRR